MAQNQPIRSLFPHLLNSAGDSVGYLPIVGLSVAGGMAANLTRTAPSTPHFADMFALFLTPQIGLPIIWILVYFFLYFTFRAMYLDRPRKLTEDNIAISVIFTSLLFPVVWLLAFITTPVDRFVLIIATTLPPTVMYLWTYHLERQETETTSILAHKFVPKIFYPAFTICFLAFCLGWLLVQSDYMDRIVFGTIAIIISFMFLFRYDKTTPTTIALSFIVIVAAVVLGSRWLQTDFGLCLLMSLLWTFALGFAEVAKRPYLLDAKLAIATPDETVDFYVSGANWSSILFLNLLLLFPLLIVGKAIFGVIALAIGAILFWHTVKDKKSVTAHRRAMLIGYLLPLAIVLLILAGDSLFSFQIVQGQGLQTDRLVTLLGVFLTIIFVLFPEEYKALMQMMARGGSFKATKNCLLFAAVVVAVEAVLVTFFFSVVNASIGMKLEDLQFRVDIILMVLIFELLFVLIFLLLLNRGGTDQEEEGSQPRPSPLPSLEPEGAGASPIGTQVKQFAHLIRPVSSAIAGAAALLFVIQVRKLPVSAALVASLCSSALCMFGFVVNDILDRHKDALSGRPDKPIAIGNISVRDAAALSVVLALSAVCLSMFIDYSAMIFTATGIFLLVGYSHFSASLPKLKGLYTGVLCCLPIMIGAGDFFWSVDPSYFVAILIFIFGREIVNDVGDSSFDRLSRHRTIAIDLGTARALPLGWVLMVVGITVLLLGSEFASAKFFLSVAGIISLILIWLAFGYRDVRAFASAARVTMILALSTILFGT